MIFRYPLTVVLYLIPVILISLSFHELSHAYISWRLGDPTAKNNNRLSLNPLAHLDILGTIMILVSGFGWAKPVPINPMYYRDRRKGVLLVSLAGPLSNILLAFVISFPMIYLESKYKIARGSFFSLLDYRALIYNFCFILFITNLNLAVFNIIPVPPLDGSKILSGILPSRQYFKLIQYENIIGVIFLLVVFAFPRVLNIIMDPFITALSMGIDFIVKPIMSIL